MIQMNSLDKLAIISWNVNSIRSNSRRLLILSKLRTLTNIDIFCIQETHLASEEDERSFTHDLHNICGLQWEVFFGRSNSENTGGTAIILSGKTHYNETKVTKTANTLTRTTSDGSCVLLNCSFSSFDFSVISLYAKVGNNTDAVISRRALFNVDLPSLIESSRLNSLPILIGGDFNCVTNPLLDRIPSRSHLDGGANELDSFIQGSDLCDAWSSATHNQNDRGFTYGQLGSMSRIDRWYIPTNFSELSSVKVLRNLNISDHHALLLKIRVPSDMRFSIRGPGPWRLPHYICRIPEFKTYMHNVLQSLIPKANGLHHLTPSERWSWIKSKIKILCIHILERWRKYKHKMELQQEQNLLHIDNMFWNNVSNPTIYNIWQHTRDLNNLESTRRMQDEAEMRRLHDFDLNERPTAYFHDKSKSGQFNRLIQPPESIHSIHDFLESAKNYFSADSPQGIFRKSDSIDLDAQSTLFNACNDFKISNLHISESENDFTLIDISEALKKTSGGKTPGPDGIPFEFYSAFPELLPFIVDVANFAMAGGDLSYSMLGGLITLLPKGTQSNNAENIPHTDFFKKLRPITLIDCDVKLIMSVVASKLTKALNPIIGPEQSAFLPDRSIFDVVITMLEVQAYAEHTNYPSFILGLDWAGAYDKLDRDFMFSCMTHLGFGSKFLKLVTALNSNTHAHVLLNGYLSNPFPTQRGVRQGDPSSPMLYILSLHFLLIYIKSAPGVVPFNGPQNTKISSMAYADDTSIVVGVQNNTIPTSIPVLNACDIWARASGSAINASKTWVLVMGGSIPQRQYIRTALQLEDSILSQAIWLNEGDVTRLLGVALMQGFSISNSSVPTTFYTKILENMSMCARRWSKVHLSLFGRSYVVNSEILSRMWYHATIHHPPNDVWNNALLIAGSFLRHGTARTNVFWDIPRWRYEAPYTRGGIGLMPPNEHVSALRCSFIFKFLFGINTLWKPFALFWFSRVSAEWNLGLNIFCSDLFQMRQQQLDMLPPHWRAAFQAWRLLKINISLALLLNTPATFLDVKDINIYFNPLILDSSNNCLKGTYWLPLVNAGIFTIQHVFTALQSPTSYSRIIFNKICLAWSYIPYSWRSHGPQLSTTPLNLLTFCGWFHLDDTSNPFQCVSDNSAVRSFRNRLWLNKNGNISSLTNFTAPRCWRSLPQVVQNLFNWKLAFSRLRRSKRGRPPLNMNHCESVFKVLHGLYMSSRPIGSWGRPHCPNCGILCDTSHAFSCQHHSTAITWFWNMAQSLLPQNEFMSRSIGTLLGGVSPCTSLSGFTKKGYVWEVLRLAFISTLYRTWVRAAIQLSYSPSSPTVQMYESRHIILSTIASVRLSILLDAKRASNGVRHVLRDGSISESNRFLSFFNDSWVAVTWANPLNSGRSIVNLNSNFPFHLDLRGLQRMNFPNNRTNIRPSPASPA